MSNTHVITAAHCLTGGSVLESVIVGETDIRQEIEEVKNEPMSNYLVIILSRESKQPNGCFSLRWTQDITA